jgi:hypothetical protein
VSESSLAYLLDSRRINFSMNPLPSNLDAAKKNMVLDYELMGRLIQRDEESFAAMVMVLMIVLAQYLGSQPKHGQTMIDLHRL